MHLKLKLTDRIVFCFIKSRVKNLTVFADNIDVNSFYIVQTDLHKKSQGGMKYECK